MKNLIEKLTSPIARYTYALGCDVLIFCVLFLGFTELFFKGDYFFCLVEASMAAIMGGKILDVDKYYIKKYLIGK